MFVAGACFILPAATIVTAIAWFYVRNDDLPAMRGLLYGIVPVVIAIVVQALAGLAPSAVKNRWLAVLAAAALAAYFAGINELLILAGGAALTVAAHVMQSFSSERRGPLALVVLALTTGPRISDGDSSRLFELFTTMLKIGAVLYGSGYVLLAFLQSDFVDRLGWLSQQQLADAIAIGQVTPGPVFTTATFVGYLVAGLPGAIVATVAIFLPSFALVGLLTRLTAWLRSSETTSALLDGVNVASLALMAGVTVDLARNSIIDPLTACLFLGAAAVLLLTKVNNGWLIVGGAAAGLLHVAW